MLRALTVTVHARYVTCANQDLSSPAWFSFHDTKTIYIIERNHLTNIFITFSII